MLKSEDAAEAKKTGKKLYASQLERVAASGPYTNMREVTKRFRAAPGDYLIIPSCYDANITGEFMLRVYTEQALEQKHVGVLEAPKKDLSDKDVFFAAAAEQLKDLSWDKLKGAAKDLASEGIARAMDKANKHHLVPEQMVKCHCGHHVKECKLYPHEKEMNLLSKVFHHHSRNRRESK